MSTLDNAASLADLVAHDRPHREAGTRALILARVALMEKSAASEAEDGHRLLDALRHTQLEIVATNLLFSATRIIP